MFKSKQNSEPSPPPAIDRPELSSSTGLKDLIEKNIKWSQVIYEQNRRINHRLTIMVVSSYIRLFLILAPIVIALIYLPPFFREFINNYGGLISGEPGNKNSGLLEEVNSFIKQYQTDGSKSASPGPTEQQIKDYFRTQQK